MSNRPGPTLTAVRRTIQEALREEGADDVTAVRLARDAAAGDLDAARALRDDTGLPVELRARLALALAKLAEQTLRETGLRLLEHGAGTPFQAPPPAPERRLNSVPGTVTSILPPPLPPKEGVS